MCGIAGLMSADGSTPDAQRLERMRQALAHRGPDGDGSYADGAVALVHTRLAIIDLDGGAQPIQSADGPVLIANAEIYNYRELRRDMPQSEFRTASDCEPPLHIYRTAGADFAASLRGMYAIAIYDPAEARLLLARDPFGIKPLYYVEGPLGFAFASEPQALLAAGVAEPTLNDTALQELLQLQFTTGRDTIFRDIKRVLPGETLTVSDGRVVDRRQRRVLPEAAPDTLGEAEALKTLEQVMLEAVDLHQRADVPYGMFLSGGIDSAVLLALMARLNERPVLAFTAGFPDTAVEDERELARTLARQVGAEHVEVAVREQDFWSRLPQAAAAVDDPTADYAVLPTYLLAEAAHAAGLKVVLCGEGGDELFAGYGRYRDAIRPWWTGGPRAMRRHGRFDQLDVLRQTPAAWRDGIGAAEGALRRGSLNRLQLAQTVDCSDWLPNDLLIKLDRCLMAHQVEGRTPFLDPRVGDFALRLPDALKVRRGQGKYLLRRWLDDNLPQARPFSRKRGFTVPVADWLGNQGERLAPLVAEQPGVLALAKPDRVRNLFSRSGKRATLAAWTLLFYAWWHQTRILGVPADGDVFAVLAETG